MRSGKRASSGLRISTRVSKGPKPPPLKGYIPEGLDVEDMNTTKGVRLDSHPLAYSSVECSGSGS